MVLRLAGFVTVCLGIVLAAASIAAVPLSWWLSASLLVAGVGLVVFVRLFDEEGT